jgi:cytochrome oxidase Cu insertion factor (SCO1/SenC/PrrC family)
MSVTQPSAAPQRRTTKRPVYSIWVWILAALVLGVALGGGVALLRKSGRGANSESPLPGRPVATWAAGAQRAPDFRLVDERGGAIALSRFRGTPVIVTFIDPVCRSLCPLEAKELNAAVAASPAGRRPVIIAVSVNPWADSREILRQDSKEWRLVPEWHWAAGRQMQLAPVWKDYKIGVLARRKVIAGVTVHDVSHTEASYVVDPAGYERALFLYPFRGRDMAAVLRRLSTSRS